MTRQEYIDKIAPIAQDACKGTGLFPSLMIAQAIVESNNGNSLLARVYNNHFGIKANGWQGRVVLLKTREVYNGASCFIKDGFRVYDSIKQGFQDRNRFLSVNPRYGNAGVFNASTPEEQAEAFQKAGYATDPNYAKLLIAVINGSGQLKKFDNH